MNNAIFYDRDKHINDLIASPFYKNLIKLRNIIELCCDDFFKQQKAPKIDLYLIANEVSSPIGRGSNSLPIPLKLGNKNAFLVDSAQFGMEPLVVGSFDMVYCYLPSFRGEDADDNHLNQFYHCEAEMKGNYEKCMNLVEKLVKHLVNSIISSYNDGQFKFPKNNFNKIKILLNKQFPVVSFDEVASYFKKKKLSHLIKTLPYGRVITREGEIEVGTLIGNNETPVWITKYDRDTVAFYQKPDPANSEIVFNADLIFPSINDSFGGEIVGSGQRQDSTSELKSSMDRQHIKNQSVYEWYINLRKHPKYQTTSGFGLGIERFIAWSLGLKSIVDAAIYPVINNE